MDLPDYPLSHLDEAKSAARDRRCGRARAAGQPRLIAAELRMADVRRQVTVLLRTEFENFSAFGPRENTEHDLTVLLE
ncbi:hypothetical protein AB0D59_27385 [Streptomyces sp. NPDC048417]|uniref:hypothetical protein n=1 Tax=Streptomyces sp. NPDC048417 TaxID=3155387 RepID=UPI00341FDB4D